MTLKTNQLELKLLFLIVLVLLLFFCLHDFTSHDTKQRSLNAHKVFCKCLLVCTSSTNELLTQSSYIPNSVFPAFDMSYTTTVRTQAHTNTYSPGRQQTYSRKKQRDRASSSGRHFPPAQTRRTRS